MDSGLGRGEASHQENSFEYFELNLYRIAEVRIYSFIPHLIFQEMKTSRKGNLDDKKEK